MMISKFSEQIMFDSSILISYKMMQFKVRKMEALVLLLLLILFYFLFYNLFLFFLFLFFLILILFSNLLF